MKLFRLFFYYFSWLLLRPFLKFFTHFQVQFQNITLIKKPIIVVANHMSFLDPSLAGITFPLFSKIHPLYFMTKDSIIKKPLLGLLLKALGGFPAKKGQGLEVSLKKPQELLAKAQTVMMFPQGKRQLIFNIEQGRVGTAALALKTKVQILPLGIIDSAPGSIKKFILRKRRVKVKIGRPFSLHQILGEKTNYSYGDYAQGTKVIMKEIGKLLKKDAII